MIRRVSAFMLIVRRESLLLEDETNSFGHTIENNTANSADGIRDTGNNDGLYEIVFDGLAIALEERQQETTSLRFGFTHSRLLRLFAISAVSMRVTFKRHVVHSFVIYSLYLLKFHKRIV